MNSLMTRRIAAALYPLRPTITGTRGASSNYAARLADWRASVEAIARILEQDSFYFDRNAFYAAAGYGTTVENAPVEPNQQTEVTPP